MAENNSSFDLPPLPASPEEAGMALEEEGSIGSSWSLSPEDALSAGKVRFLIAASLPFPVTVSVGSTVYLENASFGAVGDYMPVSDGFHRVLISYTSGPRVILFEKMFPFRAGEYVTMVILDSESSGITVSQISDTACKNLPEHYGCFRAANMSSPGSLYDILLKTGEPVFRDIPYNTVTSYKQAEEGDWTFFVSSLTCSDTYRELPTVSAANGFTACMWISPVLTFQTAIQSGKNYTSYLIGNVWSDYSLQVLTVEDGPTG